MPRADEIRQLLGEGLEESTLLPVITVHMRDASPQFISVADSAFQQTQELC